MPRVDQSTINWAVYEDNTEYAGMAQATLPNLTALTQSISGAGIAGNVDAVILGHFDAMSMTLNYRTMTEQAVRLSEPRRHNIDLRYAVQDEDPVAAAVQIRAIKHILVVIPKTHTPGYCCPGYPGERYRRVRRALLGHLYRRQESPRDRPAELYLPDRWHRLPGRCPQGPGQVICPARSADPACSCVTDGSHIYDNTPCWSANYRQVRYARREALSGHFFEE